MDGVTLARTARQRQCDLAVMLIGADVDDFAPQDLEGIADEALSKPFRPREFEQRMATLARIAEALAEVRRTPSDALHAGAIAAKKRAISDKRARIRALHMRAEELRATADQFVDSSAQEPLRRAASNYDHRANRLEAMLEGRHSASGEKAG